jgi:DNA-binding transcriptional ArsR family regulator
MDNILSYFTSHKNTHLMPNEIPSRDVFLQTETYNKFTGGAEYNKDTFIGHLKIKKGGMKIIKGEEDNNIKKERNIVLEHLHKSLKGGELDHNNLELYYKALEGGYIRNLMCPTNSSTCSNFIKNNNMAAYKLSKHALKAGNFNTLKTFKYNAPKLYNNLKGAGHIKKLKYKRDKYQNRLTDGGSVKSDSSLSVHLSKLRDTVGTRSLNESGGNITRAKLDEFLTEQRNERLSELQNLKSMIKGRVSNLSSPMYSESESYSPSKKRKLLSSLKTSTKYNNIAGGGDPLQELRMELGRLEIPDTYIG